MRYISEVGHYTRDNVKPHDSDLNYIFMWCSARIPTNSSGFMLITDPHFCLVAFFYAHGRARNSGHRSLVNLLLVLNEIWFVSLWSSSGLTIVVGGSDTSRFIVQSQSQNQSQMLKSKSKSRSRSS